MAAADFKLKVVEYVDWVAKALILGTASLIWSMYTMQGDFLKKIERNDYRITQLEQKVSAIEASMITKEALDRVELKLELILAQSGIPTNRKFSVKEK